MPVKTVTIFDCESSDIQLCQRHNKSIEIWNLGAVRLNRIGEIQDQLDLYIKPQHPEFISPCCRFLTGWEGEFEGISFTDAFKQFRRFVDNDRLMSWGLFDIPVLRQQVIEHGLTWDFRYPSFDGLSFAAGLLANYPIQPPSYGLEKLCDFFYLEKPNHRALKDCICTAKLLQKLLQT